MSTLRIRASHVPEAWVFPRFTRILSFVDAVFGVFADAQAMARKAQKRYPYMLEG